MCTLESTNHLCIFSFLPTPMSFSSSFADVSHCGRGMFLCFLFLVPTSRRALGREQWKLMLCHSESWTQQAMQVSLLPSDSCSPVTWVNIKKNVYYTKPFDFSLLVTEKNCGDNYLIMRIFQKASGN